MVGWIRPQFSGVAWLIAASTLSAAAAWADPPPQDKAQEKEKPKPAAAATGKPEGEALYAIPGGDPPQAFVPRRPRSVEDQRQIEATRDFSVARALEDQRAWAEAIA